MELTKEYIGKIIRTRFKKKWRINKVNKIITGKLVFSTHFDPVEYQLWLGPKDWVWFEHSCDKRTFQVLSEEETLIWRIEHNM